MSWATYASRIDGFYFEGSGEVPSKICGVYRTYALEMVLQSVFFGEDGFTVHTSTYAIWTTCRASGEPAAPPDDAFIRFPDHGGQNWYLVSMGGSPRSVLATMLTHIDYACAQDAIYEVIYYERAP